MKQHPRLLVISNDCISNVSSNGRTLRNFLLGWPMDRLAQFCIHSTEPDYDTCCQYFCVSDQEALRSFFTWKCASGEMVSREKNNIKAGTTGNRNSVTMLIREVVWRSMLWAGKPFHQWLKSFSPEVILLQAGDCAFMLHIARTLAEKFNIPLVIYNSEAYIFKKNDYFRSKGIMKLGYYLFHPLLRKEFRKTIMRAGCSIYCCEKLKKEYDAAFSLPSETIYTATEIVRAEEKHIGNVEVAYLGNLGLDRHEGLVEIGNVLQKISPELKLQVYGRAPTLEVERVLNSCKGIEYHGLVPYSRVVEVMRKSDVLIHTESFDDFYREDLQYAFSTKIADSLACGNCFLLYAPENIACSEYLTHNNAAYVVTRKEDLLPTLELLCSDAQARRRYQSNAIELARVNHDAKKNALRFQKIICDSVKKI